MTNIVHCSNIVHKMVNITYITEFEIVQMKEELHAIHYESRKLCLERS